jgi:chorismate synthase
MPATPGKLDHRGGGRSSARETVSRVVAGAVARVFLARCYGMEVLGYVDQVGDVCAQVPSPENVLAADVEASEVRCPDPVASAAMIKLIEQVRAERDSIGGSAQLIARGVPPGLGEPVFDKLKADLAKALFSLPAVMGVEYGAGFQVVQARGSNNNDPFVLRSGRVETLGNRHGGMLGGISSGMPILMRAAVKPTSSIPQPQQTVTKTGEETTVTVKGRHDPCLLPRFIPMAEAMILIVLADHMLRARIARRI